MKQLIVGLVVSVMATVGWTCGKVKSESTLEKSAASVENGAVSSVGASEASSDKPVQHLKVADVTSMEEAKAIFKQTTADIRGKTTLDAAQLHEIHFITYSLEKSVEYFSQNLDGDDQQLAKEMAVVVEAVHLASENNRKEETQAELEKYFSMADQLMEKL